MKLACLSHLRGKHGRSTARFFSFLRAKREGFKRVWCGVPSKLRHPQSHFNHQSHRHGRRQFHKRHTFDVFLLMRALAVIFGAIFSIKIYIYIFGKISAPQNLSDKDATTYTLTFYSLKQKCVETKVYDICLKT